MTKTRREQLAHMNRVLTDELANEAERFLRLQQQLRQLPANEENVADEQYVALEGQLYASVVHLKVHAATLQDAFDDLTDADMDLVER